MKGNRTRVHPIKSSDSNNGLTPTNNSDLMKATSDENLPKANNDYSAFYHNNKNSTLNTVNDSRSPMHLKSN